MQPPTKDNPIFKKDIDAIYDLETQSDSGEFCRDWSAAVFAKKHEQEKIARETRKSTALLLVHGYTRNNYLNKHKILPTDILSMFYNYYFQPFQAVWSCIWKSKYMKLSENNLKVTSSRYDQACRGRDPIQRGMCVEWTLQYDIGSGITIGVIKSGDNSFNTTADYELNDCYGIDNCVETIYYGNAFRHVGITEEMGIEYFYKPKLKQHNTEERVRVICDYRGEQAALIYFINDKVCKPEKQDYTFKLPKLNDDECWYMLVDFESCPAWAKIVGSCCKYFD